METLLYGPTAAAKLLNLNPRRLRRWLDFGYFKPDFKAMSGDTEYRLFSERDIQILREIIGKLEDGTPLGKAFDNGGN